jgi:hypothetical protein
VQFLQDISSPTNFTPKTLVSSLDELSSQHRLARIAIFHNVPEAYAALRAGLDDRRVEVRATAVDLIFDAYLKARRLVPQEIVDKVRQMARSDRDDDVRRLVQRFLREPWAQLDNLSGEDD